MCPPNPPCHPLSRRDRGLADPPPDASGLPCMYYMDGLLRSPFKDSLQRRFSTASAFCTALLTTNSETEKQAGSNNNNPAFPPAFLQFFLRFCIGAATRLPSYKGVKRCLLACWLFSTLVKGLGKALLAC
jgi:hypothetical protein